MDRKNKDKMNMGIMPDMAPSIPDLIPAAIGPGPLVPIITRKNKVIKIIPKEKLKKMSLNELKKIHLITQKELLGRNVSVTLENCITTEDLEEIINSIKIFSNDDE